MYNEVAYLISKINSGMDDDYGDPILTEEVSAVFCNVLSIGTSEFYQAQTIGTKPELKIVIADYYDYNDQQEVIVNDIRYKVLRTYRTLGSNELEITLYGGVRNVSS